MNTKTHKIPTRHQTSAFSATPAVNLGMVLWLLRTTLGDREISIDTLYSVLEFHVARTYTVGGGSTVTVRMDRYMGAPSRFDASVAWSAESTRDPAFAEAFAAKVAHAGRLARKLDDAFGNERAFASWSKAAEYLTALEAEARAEGKGLLAHVIAVLTRIGLQDGVL